MDFDAVIATSTQAGDGDRSVAGSRNLSFLLATEVDKEQYIEPLRRSMTGFHHDDHITSCTSRGRT